MFSRSFKNLKWAPRRCVNIWISMCYCLTFCLIFLFPLCSAEQTLPWCFLFTIILAPEPATVPGAFIEGEHKLGSGALMFSGRGGPGCEVCHRVSKRNSSRHRCFPAAAPLFHIRPVPIFVPGEFSLLLMTPLFYQDWRGGRGSVREGRVNDASTHLTKQSH